MTRTLGNIILCFVISAVLSWEVGYTSGLIYLCTDKESAKNGTTVPSTLGGTASVHFCVTSPYKIYPYVQLNYPNDTEQWYNSSETPLFNLKVTERRYSRASEPFWVNVTFTAVRERDFSKEFFVKVYIDGGGKPRYDFQVKVNFQLKKEDSDKDYSVESTTSHEIEEETACKDAETRDDGECDKEWKHFQGKCIKLFSKMSFSNATEQCHNHGSILKGLAETQQHCFGDGEVKRIWQGGKHLKECDVLKKDGKTNQILCNETLRFICEKGPRSQKGGDSTVAYDPTPPETTRTTPTTTTTTTTTTTPTTPTTTTLGPGCPPRGSFNCPSAWYSLGNGKCLNVSNNRVYGSTNAKKECDKYAGDQLDDPLDDTTRACVLYQHQQQKSSSKDILLRDCKFFNVQSKRVYSDCNRNAYYACVIDADTWEPRVTNFSLTMTRSDKKGPFSDQESLPLHTTTLNVIDVKEIFDILNFTCEATGVPVPSVSIKLGNTLLQNSADPGPVNYWVEDIGCEQAGEYICEASNVFSTTKVTKEIRVKCPVAITSFGIETSHTSFAVQKSTAKFTCIAKGYPPPPLTIFNDVGNEQWYNFSSTSVTATLTPVQCKDMGAYYCASETRLDATVSSMKAELAVDNCPIQLCRSEKTRIVPAAPGHTVNFTVCLLYYSRQEPYPINVFRDGGELGYWTWKKNYNITFQNDENSQIYHTVSIKISNVQAGDYGNITLRMTKNAKTFNYNFSLVARGPPNCPSDIQATNQDADFITLSWQPGFNGGAKQSFHVYYSTDNVTWSSVRTLEEDMVIVSNLTEDTEYAFRVVSSNMYTDVVDETVCEDTIFKRTAKRPSPDKLETTESSSEAKEVPFIVALVLIVLIATVIIIICWKRDTLKSGHRCIDSSPRDRKDDKTHNNDISDEKTEDDKHHVYSTVNEEAIRTGIIFPTTEEIVTADGYTELTAIQHNAMEENPRPLDLHPYNNLTNVEHENKENMNTDNDGYLTPLDMKADNDQAEVDKNKLKCLADVEVHCYSNQNKEYMNISGASSRHETRHQPSRKRKDADAEKKYANVI